MIITESTRLTVRTHALPRPWIVEPSPPVSREEAVGDAARLRQASEVCAESYRVQAEAFVTGDDFNHLSRLVPFGRCKGKFFWRLVALLLMPINYVFIAYLMAVPVIGLIVLAALTHVALWGMIGWPPISFWAVFFEKLPHGLQLFGEAAAVAGLCVGVLIALVPGLASGRGFGVVDAANKRAIVVFCGSRLYENLTINALIWGYWFPLRHLGFHHPFRCQAMAARCQRRR